MLYAPPTRGAASAVARLDGGIGLRREESRRRRPATSTSTSTTSATSTSCRRLALPPRPARITPGAILKSGEKFRIEVLFDYAHGHSRALRPLLDVDEENKPFFSRRRFFFLCLDVSVKKKTTTAREKKKEIDNKRFGFCGCGTFSALALCPATLQRSKMAFLNACSHYCCSDLSNRRKIDNCNGKEPEDFFCRYLFFFFRRRSQDLVSFFLFLTLALPNFRPQALLRPLRRRLPPPPPRGRRA